jgi:hypothetical protein
MIGPISRLTSKARNGLLSWPRLAISRFGLRRLARPAPTLVNRFRDVF